jgi:DNA-binding LytR/AlgR family response regulator
MPSPTALIAEDEHLLAAALKAELKLAWPELEVVATVGDGTGAARSALALKPDVLFFDIRMPGMSGLEAAAELADAWDSATPFPALVFITAYDQYAVEAFEAQAVDYVLKPVQPARLQKTVDRLKDVLSRRSNESTSMSGLATATSSLDATLKQLRLLLAAAGGPRPGAMPPAAPLRLIQVSVGSAIRMVPLEEVLYFEAADKYVRVLTGKHEYLLRTPLKELTPQLDPDDFWQIHRSVVVRAAAIDSVTRDEAGKLSLTLHGHPDRLPVSRLYAHLFKAM